MLRAGNLSLSAGVVYLLGTVLVWLGVLAWVPFIFLRMLGEKPPFWWFYRSIWPGCCGGWQSWELDYYKPEKNPVNVS